MEKNQRLKMIAEELLASFSEAVKACDEDPGKFLDLFMNAAGELAAKYGDELIYESITHVEDVPIMNIGANTLVEMVQSGEEINLQKLLN